MESNAKIHTNQQFIEELHHEKQLDIYSAKAVFSHVFKQLPKEVVVYPTENYYYFSFYNDGVEYTGNIRLDALDRDKGIVHFAYYNAYNRWNDELVNKYKTFNHKDGVKVNKLAPLRYEVVFNKKSVVFNLNNLSDVKPGISKIRSTEKYIGPVYDESGMMFYLVYNPKIKCFHYILKDDEKLADVLIPSYVSNNIFLGSRTGFAYYRDKFKNRLILIGIYNGNSVVNNFYDGPFDQLPDNFIKGNQLREAFIDQQPDLLGKIDRFGNTDSGRSRTLIAPYMHYTHEKDLGFFDNCVQGTDDKSAYYRCFSYNDDVE